VVVLRTVADSRGQYSGGWITDTLSQTRCYFKKSGNLSGFTRQETLNNGLKGMGLIRNKTGVYLLEVIRVCEGRKSRTKEQIAKG
jgi:hypothetical protein